MPETVSSCLPADASDVLVTMAEAAIRGGQEAKARLSRLQISDITQKAARDYQTEADIEVERIIASHLAANLPDIDIHGEEGAADRETAGAKARFLIDPIDGTTNYAWGIPHFGNVVTLVDKGEITAGVVYDAMQDELFSAEKGKGAFLNGRRLDMRDGDDVVNSVFGASLPIPGQVKSVSEDVYHAALRRLMDHAAGVRRFGSAALSIAYVSCGRLDGFFEDGLSAHDYGASLLLVREAGGRVTNFAGEDVGIDKSSILAAAPKHHRWLLEGFKG